jgi:hypothetical protein
MKISVVTPTIRKDGLAIVQRALKRQTFESYEWLIGSKFTPEIPEARHIKDDFHGGFWALNRIYNRLFTEAKGELVVSLQDNIWVESDGLQKFWDDYQATGGLVSGVGDQYEEIDTRGKPTIVCWNDPRKKTNKHGTFFYECVWNDCEWNWAAIPRKLFFAVGGMDEKLDFMGYGGDQLQTCERLKDYGAKFYLDQTNESFTLRHSKGDFGGQDNWEKNHVSLNGSYSKRKQELIEGKLWPILQSDSKTN